MRRTLTPEWAGRLGLCAGTAVAAGIIDAHAGLPGSGVTEPGTMLMAIGHVHVPYAAQRGEAPYAGNLRRGRRQRPAETVYL